MLTLATLATVTSTAHATSWDDPEDPDDACHETRVEALQPADGAEVSSDVVPIILLEGGCVLSWGYSLQDADGNELAGVLRTYSRPRFVELEGLELEPGEYTLSVFSEAIRLGYARFTVVDDPPEPPTITDIALRAKLVPTGHTFEADVDVEDPGAIVRMTITDTWNPGGATTNSVIGSSDAPLQTTALLLEDEVPLSELEEVCATFSLRHDDGSWSTGERVCTRDIELPDEECGLRCMTVGCSSLGRVPALGLFVFGLLGAVTRRR